MANTLTFTPDSGSPATADLVHYDPGLPDQQSIVEDVPGIGAATKGPFPARGTTKTAQIRLTDTTKSGLRAKVATWAAFRNKTGTLAAVQGDYSDSGYGRLVGVQTPARLSTGLTTFVVVELLV